MPRRRLLPCCCVLALGALLPAGALAGAGADGADGLSLLAEPPPRRASGARAAAMDPEVVGADAAFAAWLKAQRLPGASLLADPPSIDTIKAELRRQRQVRDLLGDNRYRRLTRARFKVHVYDLQLQPYREFEQVSVVYDDIESSMRSNFGKIARDWLEHRIGLDQRFERWEERRDRRRSDDHAGVGPSLSVSPRFAAGSRSYVGTKLRIRHAPNAFLSHLSLKAHYGVDDGESALRLTWQTRDHYVSLEQTFDDRHLGDVFSLQMRITF